MPKSNRALFPQQHVDRATATIGPRRVRVPEHAGNALEKRPHARFEEGEVLFGMQSPAVNDADTAMAMVAAVDELFHARHGFRRRLAVQVERAACRIISALE